MSGRLQLVTSSKVEELGPLVADHWYDDGCDKRVAQAQVDYLTSLRGDNARTAHLLKWAIAGQLGGVALFALSALFIILDLG
jgi:hypothetical protein